MRTCQTLTSPLYSQEKAGTELQRVSPGGEKKTSTFLQRLPREQASRGLWVRGGRIVEVAGKGNGGGALEGS